MTAFATFRAVALSGAVLVGSALPALADIKPEVQALADAIDMPRVIEIMRAEGLASSRDLASSYMIAASPEWEAALDRIYDPGQMLDTVLAGIDAELSAGEAEAITAFFTSELGARIITLEITAREAFMDDGIEQASQEAAARLPQEAPERFERLKTFIEVNDLVDSNVIGALNSNYAFVQGLAAAGAVDPSISEDQLLEQVYAQEPEIRRDTGQWLYSYLNLAYRPLSDEELDLYIDFSRSAHGQAMNRALFRGFDDMFDDISRNLGLAVGRIAAQEEL